MKARDRLTTDYLNDMREASEKAAQFVAGLTFDEFRANDEKVYAVIRALEVVGEAAKSIPAQLRRRYSEIPWRDVAGMRDKLIHGYFGVNLKRVWETVQIDLPLLLEVVERILKEKEQEVGEE